MARAEPFCSLMDTVSTYSQKWGPGYLCSPSPELRPWEQSEGMRGQMIVWEVKLENI